MQNSKCFTTKQILLLSTCADIAYSKPHLLQGARDPQVKKLQSFLKRLNYFTLPYTTDYFGPLTKQALQDFQKDNKISPSSGIFGKITASYIDNNCAKLKSREYFENLRKEREKENREVKEKRETKVFQNNLQKKNIATDIHTVRQIKKNLDNQIGIGVYSPKVLEAYEKSKKSIISISKDLLFKAFSFNVQMEIILALNKLMPIYGVNTVERVSHFLSQIAHESGFKPVAERGMYSIDILKQAASKTTYRQIVINKNKYIGNPRNLLNLLYADILGNGDENSGDGWRYRGRGLIQLTGKDNYRAFTTYHNKKNPQDKQDFVKNPDLLLQPKYAVSSALYFWESRGLNRIANDASEETVKKVTKIINGGYIGLSDRIKKFWNIYNLLKVNFR